MENVCDLHEYVKKRTNKAYLGKDFTWMQASGPRSDNIMSSFKYFQMCSRSVMPTSLFTSLLKTWSSPGPQESTRHCLDYQLPAYFGTKHVYFKAYFIFKN